MSYAVKQNSIVKTFASFVEIDVPSCENTFGSAPCTATGVKCYNSYTTCYDKTNFIKTIKTIRICDYDLPTSVIVQLNAKAYLLDKSFQATELNEEKTIPARATFTFADENDYDVSIDPYVHDRQNNILNIPGTFWKKFFARNKYYKNIILRYYEGYEGVAANEFKLKFVYKINKIKRSGRKVTVECVDLLKALNDIEYPIVTNNKLAADVGACYAAASNAAMLALKDLKQYDLCKRSDLPYLAAELTILDGGSLDSGDYYYWVVAYDAYDRPIAADFARDFVGSNKQVVIAWADFSDAVAYYRVWGRTEDSTSYVQTTNLTITDDGTNIFTNTATQPTKAERYFQFGGGEIADNNSWTELTGEMKIDMSGVDELPIYGYVMFDEEIIYYDNTGKSDAYLHNVSRIQLDTKTKVHYTYTTARLIFALEPNNAITHLKYMLSKGVNAAYIDDSTLDTFESSYTGIDLSTLPIIKKTNLGQLVFDLVNIIDAKLWENESGLITMKYASASTIARLITDEDIVKDSVDIDDGNEDVISQVSIYFARFDITKSITDKENFNRITIDSDAVVAGENCLDDIINKDFTTTWVNDNCGTVAEIEAHVYNVAHKKLKRLRVPRPIISLELESKDSDIATGEIVSLTTNEFNDIDGTDYTGKKFEVVKRESKKNTIAVSLQYFPEDEFTSSYNHLIVKSDNPQKINSYSLTEVEVTNLTWIKPDGTEIPENADLTPGQEIENYIDLKFDNSYASEAATCVDFAGDTRNVKDLKSWRTCKQYNLYAKIQWDAFIEIVGGPPGVVDPDGYWVLCCAIPDLHILDDTYKYKIRYVFPFEWLGKKIRGFMVYADCQLLYNDLLSNKKNVIALT